MASLTRYFGTTGKVINAAAIKRQISKELDKAAKQAVTEYKKTTATWDGQPDFAITKEGEFGRIVGTESDVYGYVDHGTRPHIIRPVNVQNLAFQTGFSAKTAINVIGSSQGGSSGPTVFAREVKHPGTDARNFSIEIAKVIQLSLTRQFDQVFQGLSK